MHAALVTESIRGIFPWCMTHNHATRAFAQLTIDAFIQHIQCTTHLSLLLSNDHFLNDADLHIWPSIQRYLIHNKEFHRLKRGLGNSLDALQGIQCHHWIQPQNVFKAPDKNDAPQGFENIPESLIEAVFAFLGNARIKVRDANDAATVAKETGSHGVASRDISHIDVPTSSRINVQRKMTPCDQLACIHGGHVSYPWMMSIDQLSQLHERTSDLEDHLNTISIDIGRQSIIIVASLIDKIPNLAGLTRTCEIFRVESMILADLSIIKAPAFKSISVTAEEWIQMEEVKPVALHPWLIGKKDEGYTCIGLEQTSQSCCLSKYRFPKRCVLVLGREKEGLPAELLSVIDVTLEIPQLGVIRSLNVHVSGALAVYEYTRQQHLAL